MIKSQYMANALCDWFGPPKSKGSDHFLASELAYMPSVASGGIVDAINLSTSLFVTPRQLLFNLHSLLGKPKVVRVVSVKPPGYTVSYLDVTSL